MKLHLQLKKGFIIMMDMKHVPSSFFATALVAIIVSKPFSAFAEWRPGLLGGFHTAGATAYATPPAYTNVFLDCHAATNYVSSSSAHNNWLPVWSNNRCWQYWGQVRLPAGTHTFAGHMDDNSTLVIAGKTIFTQSGNSQKSGEGIYVIHLQLCRSINRRGE